MIKMIKSLYPTARYLTKGRFYQFKNKDFPKNIRDEFMVNWACDTLKALHVESQCIGVIPNGPALLVGNHVSYIDIPLILKYSPSLFLSKKEISYWPIIGNAAKMVDIIFVDRDSISSRKKSLQNLAKKILDQGERVVVFPAGTTSIEPNQHWKQGTFKLAKIHKIPIQPFKITYSPLRTAAYIGDDILFHHVKNLLNFTIQATIEFKEPRLITDVDKDIEPIRAWCQQTT